MKSPETANPIPAPATGPSLEPGREEGRPLDQILAIGLNLATAVLAPLKEAFVGKDEIIDLLGVSLVAGENLFLLGPPGTAKSALVRELGLRLKGATFEYLLTRFTEPSEIFGPFDIRKLRDGELITNTEGMLPEASLVFLDELLNANSAILNSLLTVLNERMFRRGKESRRLPTLMVVGASNHLPEDDALEALFDRFMLRVTCDNVDEEDLTKVLVAGWTLDNPVRSETTTVDIEQIRQLHGILFQVCLDAIRPNLADLVVRLRQAGVALTDRRAVKLQRLIGASALLSGRSIARHSDLWVLRHIWDNQEQESIVREIVDSFLRRVEPQAADHPRSREGRPDPESLARDLASIDAELAGKRLDAPRIAILSDRLGLIGERIQWVPTGPARQELEQQLETIRDRLRLTS